MLFSDGGDLGMGKGLPERTGHASPTMRVFGGT